MDRLNDIRRLDKIGRPKLAAIMGTESSNSAQ
jgi:hypothetical protein